ncbi:MAG: glutamine amidotransferase, partial [Phycisphaerales bacterium]
NEVRTKLEGGSAMIGLESATDLASGVRLAMSMIPPDAAGRLTLVSDGNETQGSLLTAARAAAAAGVPIDVLPIDYKYENEVIFDGLYAPATARKGQTISVRMSLTAKKEMTGELTLMMGDRPVDLSPDDPATFGQMYTLNEGVNTLLVPVTVSRPGALEFKAFFAPVEGSGDSIAENNTAAGVTFVSAEGAVLLLCDNPAAAAPMVDALEESRISVELRHSSEAPRSLAELQEFDAVVLMDVPAYSFDFAQQKEMASYVRDAGGGLVMIGGENSFGAGGWIGSPVAEVLPLLLEPPEKRNIPKGALAMIMHSIEIPNGVYLGKQTAKAAVGALSSRDEVGILEYSWSTGSSDGVRWIFPMQEKGDGTAANAAIANMNFGDMPDYGAPMQAAYNSLVNVKAGQKHLIMVTDGDATMPSITLVNQYQAAKITITTVCVDPHGGSNDVTNMKNLAYATGGRNYTIYSRGNQGQLAQLPEIFIKEAQTVKRSLIWEGDPFNPKVVNGAAEAMRGIGGTLPAMSGYVVTADREGLALTTARTAEDDPLVAQWQHGLGRAVAFTSDAATKWSEDWVAWGRYKQFWEQHIRWAMRPAGAANLSVATETRGDATHVIVTALDSVGDPLNFAAFRGAVVDPDLKAQGFELTQTAPGRYEGDFASNKAGTHIVTLRYDAAGVDGGAPDRGSVQAAVLRPYPDEYRALEDNTPLLQQVADLTGGRVLPDNDPAGADLFSRQGLTMPVSLRSIWLAIALVSLGIFLTDVAVRRVRIDIPAIISWARGLFKAKGSTASQVDALRAARQTTRAKLAERAARSEKGAKAEAPAAIDKGRKFEAGDEYLKKPARSVTDAPAPIVDNAECCRICSNRAKSGQERRGRAGGCRGLLAAKKRSRIR